MADLGRQVGLSRTAVLARVQRLERDGVIRGYRAVVQLPGVAAAHRARVGIVIRTTDVAGYVRRLAALPGFDDIETVTGEYDLIVRVHRADARPSWTPCSTGYRAGGRPCAPRPGWCCAATAR